MNYALDPSTRVIDDATIVIGGSPLTVFRVTGAGAAVVKALLDGTELPSHHEALTDRLLDAGAIHPVPDPDRGTPASSVTAVIPVRDGDRAALERLVAGLRAEGVARILVVDDASAVPVAAITGAEVVRLPRNLGPGGARNAGLAQATTDVVVVLDADTTPTPGWIAPLLAHFTDDRVGLVAPRIRGAGGPGWLARFETDRSPLDLGPQAARIRSGTRVSYVPAAALALRRRAFEAVGGFDPALRFGEDVDLVWRLDEAGWGCRYEPTATVGHATRPTLGAWLRQRFEYGTSAGPLARRHQGALAPVRVSGWSAAAWAIAGLWSVPAGTALGAATTAALTRKLRPMRRPLLEAARLGGLGNLFAGRIIAAALTRVWWPLSVLAALGSRRARRVVLAAIIVPAALDVRRDLDVCRNGGGLDPIRGLVLRLLDDAAYGAGVWVGAWRAGTIAPLLPDLSNWPGRTNRARADSATTSRRRGPSPPPAAG